MSDRNEPDWVKIAETRVKPAIDEIVKHIADNARSKLEEEAEHVIELYKQFLKSKLSLNEFAKKMYIPQPTLWQTFHKFRLQTNIEAK